MKIPIKKTNRKVPVSSWATRIEVVTLVRNTSKGMFDPLSPLVKDISKGLENPLDARTWETVFEEWKATHPHQKGDWNEWHKDMGGTPLTVSNMSGFTPGESVTILHEGEYKHGIISELPKEKRKTKPSLLTKLKNKLRR